MSGINEAQVLGGHTAKIMIDGKEVGWMADVSWNIDHGLKDAPVVGQVTIAEHQQTAYAVSGEARRYFVRDEIVSPGSGLVPMSAAEAVAAGAFDLDVMDTVTGKRIIRLERVSLASNGSAIQANQLVTRRISFRAINTQG